MKNKKLIIALYGLVDSGKTTVAKAMLKHLPHATFIDAHRFRDLFDNSDYSPNGRMLNINKLADTLDVIEGGGVVILAFNLPTFEMRKVLKDRHDAKMVLCAADLATCKQRDTKGLYAQCDATFDMKLPLLGLDYDTLGTDMVVDTGNCDGVSPEKNAAECACCVIDKLIAPHFQDYKI